MSPKRQNKRNSRGFQERMPRVERLPVRQNFLIICEGEQTERNYFESFPVQTDVKVRVYGAGDNTINVVKTAIDMRDEGDYNQVWCVFDRDSFPPQHFNEALALARRESIGVAYSNEAFELWYLLHFEYLQVGLQRAMYQAKLDTHLGKRYSKNSRTIYQEIEFKQDDALRNAARLLAIYSPPNPAQDNPSTTVHLLVSELRRFSRS